MFGMVAGRMSSGTISRTGAGTIMRAEEAGAQIPRGSGAGARSPMPGPGPRSSEFGPGPWRLDQGRVGSIDVARWKNRGPTTIKASRTQSMWRTTAMREVLKASSLQSCPLFHTAYSANHPCRERQPAEDTAGSHTGKKPALRRQLGSDGQGGGGSSTSPSCRSSRHIFKLVPQCGDSTSPPSSPGYQFNVSTTFSI